MQTHRPLGVTIIAILFAIAGVRFLAIGALLLIVIIGFIYSISDSVFYCGVWFMER